MFDFEMPDIDIVEISDNERYGKFIVEPLVNGCGIALGNSLRRIMLSSMPGCAVSQVKIDGVLHEFSCIPGVKEDVTEIVMNLKKLVIKNCSKSRKVTTAYIDYKGEGVVTAADIQTDPDIEILNKNQLIATLSSGPDCGLHMELTITNGRGYVSAEDSRNGRFPINAIAMDSNYTPIERVNFTVENAGNDQITDLEKLTLEVFTNGAIAPSEAVSLAAKIMSDHLNLFIDFLK